MDLVSLGIIGGCAGVISSLFGLGGGIILIPSLTLMGYDITYAVGLSIVQMVFVSFLGSYLNYKKQRINLQLGTLLGIGGLIGASFNSLLLKHLSSKTLYMIFLCFLLFSFYHYFFGKTITYEKKEVSFYRKCLILIPSGCIIGLFSSSLGVGGALLLVPLCGYFFGLNSKEVAPLGLFFICFSSFSGAISLYYSGFVHLQEGLSLACFSMMGTLVGNLLLNQITPLWHKRFLALIYLFSISSILSKILLPSQG